MFENSIQIRIMLVSFSGSVVLGGLRGIAEAFIQAGVLAQIPSFVDWLIAGAVGFGLLIFLVTFIWHFGGKFLQEWNRRSEKLEELEERVDELELIVGDNLDQNQRLVEPLNQAVRRLYRSHYNPEFEELGTAEKDEVEAAFTKALAPLIEEKLSDRVQDQLNIHSLLRYPSFDLTRAFLRDFRQNHDVDYNKYMKAPEWLVKKQDHRE